MGSDPTRDPQARQDEQPAHQVCFTHGFWLDQFTITNAAFDAFVRAGGYQTDIYWSVDGLVWKRSGNISGPDTNCRMLSSDPQQPRVCLKWYEAEAYANWRTQAASDGTVYRLPTEAEWEYAARGPQSLIYPWGNSFDSSRLNYCDKNCSEPWVDMSVDDGYVYASPVNTYMNGKSWVNAYDMSGNVWQWVSDWYSHDYYQHSPGYNPTGPTDGITHVIRGGAWDSSPYSLRAAFRNNLDTFRDLNIGFRVIGILPAS
jgi:formylglycine-generating enzyme required for sulfatase activity